MAFSQLTIVVDGGGGTNASVVIPLPVAVTSDPNNQLQEGSSAQTQPGVGGIVQTIAKLGFWDAPGLNFYAPAAIRKITPS